MKIDCEIFKGLRAKAGLTQSRLSKISCIGQATIARIENGEDRNTRELTIKRLANALKVNPAVLTGEESLEPHHRFSFQADFPVPLFDQELNALDLVAMRYGVSPTKILRLAPLLFHIVAGESLQERERILQEVEAAREQLVTIAQPLKHLSDRLAHDGTADEVIRAEERAIRKNDVFGLGLDDASEGVDVRSFGYEHDLQNPFAAHVLQRVTALQGWNEWQGEVSVLGHHENDHEFTLCETEALVWCGDDKDAAGSILYGAVRMRDIPAELRKGGGGSERAQWVNHKMVEQEKEWDRLGDSLLKERGI